MSLIDRLSVVPLLYVCAGLLAAVIGLVVAFTWRGKTLDTCTAKLEGAATSIGNATAANKAQENIIVGLRLQVAELGYRNALDRQATWDMLAERQKRDTSRQASLQARIAELEVLNDPTGAADQPMGPEFERMMRR